MGFTVFASVRTRPSLRVDTRREAPPRRVRSLYPAKMRCKEWNIVTNPERPDLMLAMDTSGDVCSLAILRDGQFVAEHTFRHGMRLSERLFAHVAGILQEADAVLDDVSAFAVGLGPGSFTGTRIGVMTMKTLAVVQSKPLYGVNSLEAMAMEYQGIENVTLVPILPCRTNVVLAAAYALAGEKPKACIEAATFALDELVARLQTIGSRHFVFCGPVAARYSSELRTLLTPSAETISFGAVTSSRASQVARLAHLRQTGGEAGEDALALVPLYIAPPPISIPRPENRPPAFVETNS